MNELLNQLSAFELIELQTIYFDLANSTLTIFTTALSEGVKLVDASLCKFMLPVSPPPFPVSCSLG